MYVNRMIAVAGMGEGLQAPNKWHCAAAEENGGYEHNGERARRQQRCRRRIGREAVRNCAAEAAEPHDGLLLQREMQVCVTVEQPGDREHVEGAADKDGDDGGECEADVPSVMADEGAHAEIGEHYGFRNLAQQPREMRHAHLRDGAEIGVRVMAHDDSCSEDGDDAAEGERLREKIRQIAQNDHHGALEYREHEHATIPAHQM